MSTAFCVAPPSRYHLRRLRTTPYSCERRTPPSPPQPQPPQLGRRAAAAAAAALLIATSGIEPPPAHALGLAPTPINPYAKRRAAKAYAEYIHRLESNLEELPLGDLKRVVETGGGGLSVSYRVAGFAAFVAATLSVLVVHPIDSVKTRLQASRTPTDLFDGLYAGVLGNVLKEAPNAAIYLGVYEIIKGALMGTPVTPLFRDLPLLTFLLAGALGDAVGSVVRVPAEVVNKRLQLGLSDGFAGAVRDIFVEKAGRTSLTSAWAGVLLRDVPFGGIQIMLYEFGKMWMQAHAASLPGFIPSHGLPADILVGSVVGAFTAFVTTPADVIVTRIAMAGADGEAAYVGVWQHLKAVVRASGLGGLFSGAVQRGAYYFVMSALFFGLYEKTSHYVSHPSVVVDAIRETAHQLVAHLDALLGIMGPSVFVLPPESWSSTLFLFVQDLPLFLSFLSIQG